MNNRHCITRTNTIDVYRGKSFHYAGNWTEGQIYKNDEYQTDFVTYEGKLWAVAPGKTHQADEHNTPTADSKLWRIAVDCGNSGGDHDGGVVDITNWINNGNDTI